MGISSLRTALGPEDGHQGKMGTLYAEAVVMVTGKEPGTLMEISGKFILILPDDLMADR